MGLSESLVLFVGSDDVLEIPKRAEPAPVAPRPVRQKKPPRKACVVRCSADAYTLLSGFALGCDASMARVVDELVYLLGTDPVVREAVIAALDE